VRGHQRKQVERLVRCASPRIRIGELGDQTKSKRTADELFSSVSNGADLRAWALRRGTLDRHAAAPYLWLGPAVPHAAEIAMLAHQLPPPTPEQYLDAEAQGVLRHEFIDGEIVAMVGGTQRHNRISGNAYAILRQHLRGRPCQPFIADVKLHIARANCYYYPDVMVVCGDGSAIADQQPVVEDARLVIEVLSPSTEGIDRREKLHAYRRLPGLQEYVLIAQDRQQVEVYRRQGEVGWLYLTYEPGDDVEWASVALTVPMTELYEGTDTPTHAPPAQ